MRKKLKSDLIPWLLISALVINAACRQGSETAVADAYTCPMHPTVTSDAPGSCPVCGMDLVRRTKQADVSTITEDLAYALRSPNEVMTASIRTIHGEYRSLPQSLEASGIVTYDPRGTATISARLSGRLEKVYLKFAYQPVRKGQRIADIYSPELLTAQRELLYIIANDSENAGLLESARNKLSRLGASTEQIRNIIATQQPLSAFPIYSPYDGYVVSDVDPAPIALASGMEEGMQRASADRDVSQSATSLKTSGLIREGAYVSAGESLFKIVSASNIRINLSLPGSNVGKMAIQDEVDLLLRDGTHIKGKVDFIQPYVNADQPFITVTLYAKNNGTLRLGQLLHGTITLKPIEAFWIPQEAVQDLGTTKIVFVKERQVFVPKHVQTGAAASGWIAIVHGLASSDEIASNAQFMIDHDSFVKPER